MSAGLMAARLHSVLAGRPRSDVFHLYVGPTTPTGRTPRSVRPVCNAPTRPLTILRRCGVTVDTHGGRLCARCSARLSAIARRAEQPPANVDARRVFWESTGITSTDLVYALALAATVEETHAIANITNALFGPAPVRRPVSDVKAQGRFDFEQQLLARRRTLALAELTPEQREAAAAKRDLDAARDAQIIAAQKKTDQVARAVDRQLAGRYLMPHERELLANSA